MRILLSEKQFLAVVKILPRPPLQAHHMMTVCSYHVTCAFQSESTLYSYLNVKKFLAQNRSKIWSLSDCKGTRTHNQLVLKWTLNHLAKHSMNTQPFNHLASLAEWLSVCLRTKWLSVWVPLQPLTQYDP